jgi:hypothetical protein
MTRTFLNINIKSYLNEQYTKNILDNINKFIINEGSPKVTQSILDDFISTIFFKFNDINDINNIKILFDKLNDNNIKLGYEKPDIINSYAIVTINTIYTNTLTKFKYYNNYQYNSNSQKIFPHIKDFNMQYILNTISITNDYCYTNIIFNIIYIFIIMFTKISINPLELVKITTTIYIHYTTIYNSFITCRDYKRLKKID